MTVYYNENDPRKAAWIRESIKAGIIAPGEVDERSIKEVEPADLKGFRQCHFFAGIGAWSYALRLAGWEDDRPVWTGSCPCPSFSAAGKGKGFNDPRHLWPDWYRLIRECRPARIFGEQVAAAIGHGWLDLVQTDLEKEAYAVGKAVLGACSVGAPHIRQRLYFGAHAASDRRKYEQTFAGGNGKGTYAGEQGRESGIDGQPFIGANAKGLGRRIWHADDKRSPDGKVHAFANNCETGERANNASDRRWEERTDDCRLNERDRSKGKPAGFDSGGEFGECNDTIGAGLEGFTGDVRERNRPGWLDAQQTRSVAEAGATRGFWANCDWWYGRDGKYRPIEPGVFPLAHGVSHRVLKLRGYGDAITPQVAAAFIKATWAAEAETGVGIT
jgi:DNA (cytosine-5)-methyltransferase 1